jgi:3-oxoacyl-[acyl-carrier protein] reductase
MGVFDPATLAPRAGTRLLIVGGCGGIGRALTASALQADLRVAVFDLPGSLAQHGPPPDVWTRPIDATDHQQVDAAVVALARAWGGIDALVNLAGFTIERTAMHELPVDQFDEVVDGGFKTTHRVARAVIPVMKASGGGAIVHTASGLAVRVLPGYGPYAASKAAVIALTKAIAIENAPAIRANLIAPGAVDTEFFTGGTGRSQIARTFDRATYVKSVPMGRIATIEDVVGPILFLLGEGARFMTGQVLHINGGGLTP